MVPAELERALGRGGALAAVVTPRGQNPTGAALDAQRAGELRAVLAASPRTLAIEDDHLGQVADTPLHTTAGASELWCSTRSVAKALGPDLRLAVLAGDAHTVARVQGAQQCGPGWVSHILQRLVWALWADPDVAAGCERARELYARRRGELVARLTRRGIEAHGRSGMNVWIPVSDEAAVVSALLQRGWAVAPGAPYRIAAAPAIRVTAATLEPTDAGVLAADIAEVLGAPAALRSG
jgi:DNA-binding transcriptional MocR family regulator